MYSVFMILGSVSKNASVSNMQNILASLLLSLALPSLNPRLRFLDSSSSIGTG
jgi:hypothetical protein